MTKEQLESAARNWVKIQAVLASGLDGELSEKTLYFLARKLEAGEEPPRLMHVGRAMQITKMR